MHLGRPSSRQQRRHPPELRRGDEGGKGVRYPVLGDRDHLDPPAPQQGLECHGMFPLAGEAGELPDQDDLEGGGGTTGLVQHRSKLGPRGDAPALGLVHVLTSHDVALLGGVVPQRPQLGGHGEVHVLPVTGHAGVERRGDWVRSVRH